METRLEKPKKMQTQTANEADTRFFAEAFTHPVTRDPYQVPPALKQVATRLCRSYGIRGVCDPMYIANVIAVELGLGDGLSNFNTGETNQ